MELTSPAPPEQPSEGHAHTDRLARVFTVSHSDLDFAEAVEEEPQANFRTVWISDVHLGTRGCKSRELLDFLRGIRCEHLFIVGDLIDAWCLKKSWYWPPEHNTVIQKILRMARKGTKVTYVPGNHDEFFRDFVGLTFGDIVICQRAVHTTADGRQFLILHGDEFDGVVRRHRWLALLGTTAYNFLLFMNGPLNWIRRRLGFSYWSLSAYMKQRVKETVALLSRFERSVVHEARRFGVQGVICGHSHHAAMTQFDDVLYINDGDWVESCTALVEHHTGRLEILALAPTESQ